MQRDYNWEVDKVIQVNEVRNPRVILHCDSVQCSYIVSEIYDTSIANVQDINKLFHYFILRIINSEIKKIFTYIIIYNLSMYLQTNEPHKNQFYLE